MKQERESLYDAAGQGDRGAVKVFLARGVAVDAVPNEYCRTPLVNAAEKGHMPVVKLLLSRGASIDSGNYASPLRSAIEGKKPEMALFLLAQGADCSDCKLIEQAIDAGLPEVAEAIIRRGALADAKQAGAILLRASSEGLATVVDCALANGAAVNWRNGDGETALHLAAKRGRLNVARILLRAGANVSAVNDHQRTALHMAADGGRHEVAQALLDGGAEVNARDFLGFTPLHLGVRKDSPATAEVLMLGGASPEIPDSFGHTSLEWSQDSPSLLEILARPGMPYKQAAKGSAKPDPPADLEQGRARAISYISRRVTEIFVEQARPGTEPAEILPMTNFINDLNFDSLDTVEIIMELEDEFDISIPDEEADKICTVGDVVDFVLKALLPPSAQRARPTFSS